MSDPRFLPVDEFGRMSRLVEECGEVLQAVGKAARFGMAERHPDGGPTNVESLVEELRDLQGAINAVFPDLLAELRKIKAGGGNPRIGGVCVVCRGAPLELRGEFWCCVKCGGSYGTQPVGAPVDQDAVP